jgi:hypothetical protein
MARFEFGPHRYSSKAAAQDDIKAMRGRYTAVLSRTPLPPGGVIRITNVLDSNKLLHLWKTHHPHFDYKVGKAGGIAYIGARQNDRVANCDAQFVIVGPTGKQIVMSVVLPFAAPNPVSIWMHALRGMVADQSREYVQGLEFPVICGATGDPLDRYQVQADHFPTSFGEIALTFLETHYGGGLLEWLSHYHPADHYGFFKDHEGSHDDGWFIDDQLVQEWQDFHRERAAYRPIGGSANSSEGQAIKAQLAPRIAALRARFGTKKFAVVNNAPA